MTKEEIRALAEQVIVERLTTTMHVVGWTKKGRCLATRCAPFTAAETRWENLRARTT